VIVCSVAIPLGKVDDDGEDDNDKNGVGADDGWSPWAEVPPSRAGCIDRIITTCDGVQVVFPRAELAVGGVSGDQAGAPNTTMPPLAGPPASATGSSEHPDCSEHFAAVLAALSAAVKERIADSGAAVLFSGGVDCAVLAALAHRHLPPGKPIELINVAYGVNDDARARAPDRITAVAGIEALRAAFPDREWSLTLVDVSPSKVEAARARIMGLIAPLGTVMDFSLGAAFWFAAGRGLPPRDQQPPNDTVAPSRVLLLGTGADELFGGYRRHAAAFARDSWPGLARELDGDVQRLHTRNLGRDDRVIADNGVEARHPFLAEGVVAAALACPLWARCDPRTPGGTYVTTIFIYFLFYF
jgi:asparagine synthetase B (glutamine-hydrolysing)